MFLLHSDYFLQTHFGPCTIYSQVTPSCWIFCPIMSGRMWGCKSNKRQEECWNVRLILSRNCCEFNGATGIWRHVYTYVHMDQFSWDELYLHTLLLWITLLLEMSMDPLYLHNIKEKRLMAQISVWFFLQEVFSPYHWTSNHQN